LAALAFYFPTIICRVLAANSLWKGEGVGGHKKKPTAARQQSSRRYKLRQTLVHRTVQQHIAF
jgi:hypothetical protein